MENNIKSENELLAMIYLLIEFLTVLDYGEGITQILIFTKIE